MIKPKRPAARTGMGAEFFTLVLLLCLIFAEANAPALDRISATITATNSPVTNGCSITVNSDTRTATNNTALNPAIYWQTNATANGAITNLFQHLATYRISSSINTTYANTNALTIQAGVGASLNVTIGGSWASVTYSTQLVSTPFTVPVIVPFTVMAATNASNVASLLMDGLNGFAPAAQQPITNVVNLGESNATVKPLFVTKTNGQANFLSLEGPSLSITPTSIVISANSGGITNLNGLTNVQQWFSATATGTDFTITTRTGTTGGSNIFDLPFSSATSTGKLSKADWSTFNAKQPGSAILTNLAGTGAATNTALLIYRGPTNNGVGSPLILTAGAGLSASTNNGTNFTIASDFDKRWARFQANYTTNFDIFGDSLYESTARTAVQYIYITGADSTSSDGAGIAFDTVDGETNGFSGQRIWIPSLNVKASIRLSVGQTDTNYSMWFALAQNTLTNVFQRTPGDHIAGFRYWAGETNFMAYTSRNGVSNTTDTAVSADPTVTAVHEFTIETILNSANALKVIFSIDGVVKATHTTPTQSGVPSAASLFRVVFGYKDEQAAGNYPTVEWVRLRQDH